MVAFVYRNIGDIMHRDAVIEAERGSMWSRHAMSGDGISTIVA